MIAKDYKELIVWQKSMDLVEEIYILLQTFPKEEMFALTNQMKRSAVSIPSNIAEGEQRNSDKDFVKFLFIARGSNAELQTQLYIALRLGYITNEQAEKAMDLCTEIAKMLNSLISKLKANN